MHRILLTALAAAAALAALAVSTHPSAATTLRHSSFARGAVTQTSSNWAGYAVTPPAPAAGTAATTFSAASGSWTQPAATCTRGAASYSAFWVGLGGFSGRSSALEQTGTEADCSAGGLPSYSAWYELVPAPPVSVPLTVNPGDSIAASVVVAGQTVTVTLTNTTTGSTFTQQLPMASPDLSSAEWIAEAPSTCTPAGCRPLPLTNFGTASFTSSSATGNGHVGTISDPAWTATAVSLQGSGTGSSIRGRFGTAFPSVSVVPTALSSDGSSFAASWQQSTVAPTRPNVGGYRRGWRGGH